MTAPTWVLNAVAALIILLGMATVLALVVTALFALADYIAKTTGNLRWFFRFVIWRARKGPHPDLAEHIERANKAEGEMESMRWKVSRIEEKVKKAVAGLEQDHPGHLYVFTLKEALGLVADYESWLKSLQEAAEAPHE